MSDRILCVDDDPRVLEAYQRQLRKGFLIDTAEDAEQALAKIAAEGPYAVVVCDARMPGMNGVQLLAEIRKRVPDSVRIMLTGHSDLQTAIDAVNEGNIFRFLSKPCPTEVLAKALTAGVEQHRLVTAERELLEKTLSGSVKVLTDVLALVNPAAFGRAQRVRRLAEKIAQQMHVPELWHVQIAAMLSQLGLMALPPETVEKLYVGKPLLEDEQYMFASHPEIGRDWVANIPRLEKVAEAIAYQEKHFDGGGIPRDELRGDQIPLGARILKVALDCDALDMQGCPWRQIVERLQQRSGWYDPQVLAALRLIRGAEVRNDVREVTLSQLTSGMIIAEDVRTVTGLLVICKGQEATRSLREQLKYFTKRSPIREPIQVLVQPSKRPEAADAVPAAGPKGSTGTAPARSVPNDAYRTADR
jgi:response regulator RpfG family c-di-GMP phosphodiesterase